MKRFLSSFCVLALCTGVHAQELTREMTDLYEVCQIIRDAVKAGSSTGLASANEKLKKMDVDYFRSLHVMDDSSIGLNGHLVFDTCFLDSLIVNRGVYDFSEKYERERSNRHRGSSSGGKLFSRTLAVDPGASVRFSMVSRGVQELAFVTEPGGMVSVRIHDITHDRWYNDTKDVRKGRPYRSFAFNLPDAEVSRLEIEVTNCTEEAFSFVVLSN